LNICILSGNCPRDIAIDSIFVSSDQCSTPQWLASLRRCGVADAADEAELDDIYETERRLLYVACTRAREHLLLTGISPVSEYLSDMQTTAG
jgi:ATP-dependent exoDNAse (exonuclease V) beta subunit